MTLRNLEIFLMVISEGSMRKAAEKLYISQPTVSGAIAELEKECGTMLFDRIGKKLFLLPKGKELAEYAVKMLNLNDELHRKICNTADTAPLHIGATLTVGTCIMANIVKKMQGIAPLILVKNTHIIEKQLMLNHLDIGLVEGSIENKDLIVEPVIHDELVLIAKATDTIQKKESISIEELSTLPFISREKGSGTRQSLDEAFASLGKKPDVRWESNNTEAILNAVLADLGYAVMSYRLIEGRQKLKSIPISGIDFRRKFSLVYHKDKYLNDKMKEFMDICRNWK